MQRASAMSALPPAYSRALRLRDRGLDPKAIARELGLEQDEIVALLQVADAKLKRLMEKGNPEMSAAKEAADRHIAAFNAHDPDAHSANETADIEWVMPGGISVRGPEQVKGIQMSYWDAFPDVRVTLVNQIVADPFVVTEGIFTGTLTGTLKTPQGDIPATGNQISLRYVTVQRVEDNKIASEHLYFDQVEFMTQLGLMPAPAAG